MVGSKLVPAISVASFGLNLRSHLYPLVCPGVPPPGGVLPYMGHIGMCRCEGYGFQAVYSSMRYIKQSVWVLNRLSFFTKLTSWLTRPRKPGIYSSIG